MNFVRLGTISTLLNVVFPATSTIPGIYFLISVDERMKQ